MFRDLYGHEVHARYGLYLLMLCTDVWAEKHRMLCGTKGFGPRKSPIATSVFEGERLVVSCLSHLSNGSICSMADTLTIHALLPFSKRAVVDVVPSQISGY